VASRATTDVTIIISNAEPGCEALTRRDVPFIFFSGLVGRLSERWSTTPIVPKPAAPKTIIGALKFVLSPSQRGDNARLSRIDQAIFAGEERIQRIRCGIARLASSGADTSVAEGLVATMTELVEKLRAHRHMSAHLASKVVR